jgi:integrase
MTTMTEHLEDYIAVRRSLGYDLSFTARVLRGFTALADREGADHITVDLFLRWKESFGGASNNTWATRLGMVRGFASWLQGQDARTEVPPAGLIAGRLRRSRPYIYSEAELAAIVVRASKLPSRYGMRGWTCSALFGLIAVTGLRINEALALDNNDVDLEESVITVRRGKNGTARFVPLAPSTVTRLRAYRAERLRLLVPSHSPFLLMESGERPTDCCARYNFALVSQDLGLRAPQRFCKHGRWPRIHGMRHTFAVRTIIGWYRKGLDPDRELIKLSTYLGHAKPEPTYWYIEAVPELLHLASKRAKRALAAAYWRGMDDENVCTVGLLAAVLHRTARRTDEGQPEHGQQLSRHVPPAPALCSRSAEEGSDGVADRGYRRPARRRLPHRSREDAEQLCAEPKHASRGHPLLLQVRRRQRAAAAASLPACACLAGEATREAGDRLSRS